jgi:hypothetical protein
MTSRLAFCALLLGAAPAMATTVVRASFEDLAQVSDVVLHGVVRAVDDELATSPTGPFRTAVEIEVLAVLKGAGRSTLRLELPGGRAGNRVMRIPGMPHFAPGDEIVIFLEALPRGGFAITGLAQGLFRVDPSGGLTRDLRGLGLVDRSGLHVHAPLAAPGTLFELQERLREVAPCPGSWPSSSSWRRCRRSPSR